MGTTVSFICRKNASLIIPGSRYHTAESMPWITLWFLLISCLDTAVDDWFGGSFVGETVYHREHTHITTSAESYNGSNVGRSVVTSHNCDLGHCQHDFVYPRRLICFGDMVLIISTEPGTHDRQLQLYLPVILRSYNHLSVSLRNAYGLANLIYASLT